MGFGEHLKEELEYRGMLVKELAYATGIPKRTLDKYLLANGAMPAADKAVAIAHTLGVSVEYLVTGKKAAQAKAAQVASSPEMRSISNCVEPLSYEKRKIVERSVAELVALMQKPLCDEPASMTLLQKVFLRLFR